jgi:hypothetical protein
VPPGKSAFAVQLNEGGSSNKSGSGDGDDDDDALANMHSSHVCYMLQLCARPAAQFLDVIPITWLNVFFKALVRVF